MEQTKMESTKSQKEILDNALKNLSENTSRDPPKASNPYVKEYTRKIYENMTPDVVDKMLRMHN
jgi:hypothetical protein